MTDKYRIIFEDALNSEPVKPSLTLNDNVLLEPSEVLALVGSPGVGKSQLFEGLVYSFFCKKNGKPINQKKSFGFIFSDEVCEGRILHIDTERTRSDINNSIKRLSKRNEGIEGMQESYTLNSQTTCLQKENTESLKIELDKAKKEGKPYTVLFLDGILDFNITNKDVMMDAEGGVKTIKYITSLATTYNCIIICTIHPNHESEKASGHIGSSLHKWCRAMLMLRGKSGYKDVFEITAKFGQGKQSHGKKIEDVFYLWDNELGYNVAVPFVDIEDRKSQPGRKSKLAPFEYYKTEDVCRKLISKVFDNEDLTKTELKDRLSLAIQEEAMDEVNSGRDAVNEFIEYLTKKDFIILQRDGKKKLYKAKKVVKKLEVIQTSIC
jgi:hypothetical protein